MKNKALVLLSLAIGFLMVSVPIYAHHSDANFDRAHLVTIKGTVTKYEFINPHVQIYVKVKEANGQFRIWTTQADAPGPMRKEGWYPDTLKPGDEVTLWGFANKDGRPGMTWVRIVMGDGRVLPMPIGKKIFLGEFLQHHGKELPREEYEVYKSWIAGEVLPESITDQVISK